MMPRIRLAALMEMPEDAFTKFVHQIEASTLFKKLRFPSEGNKRVIRFARFPGTGFSTGFLEFKDEMNRDAANAGVEELLEGHTELLALIRKLGIEQFEQLFLLNEECLTAQEVAERCALPLKDIERIHELVNEVSVRDEFCHPSPLPLASHVQYYKIAVISENGRGALTVTFVSQRFLSGRYIVDVPLLELLRSQGYFSDDEVGSLTKLLKDIELVNDRRSTMYRILQVLVAKQEKYLRSGAIEDLIPYTQKDLAKDLAVDESLVSRALQRRSVQLPDGSEKPLKHLLVNRKSVMKRLIKAIVTYGGSLTDREIQERLKERHGFAIARRTVNAYKK
jgi:hypothetical protein